GARTRRALDDDRMPASNVRRSHRNGGRSGQGSRGGTARRDDRDHEGRLRGARVAGQEAAAKEVSPSIRTGSSETCANGSSTGSEARGETSLARADAVALTRSSSAVDAGSSPETPSRSDVS